MGLLGDTAGLRCVRPTTLSPPPRPPYLPARAPAAANPADFADVAWHFGRASGAQQRYAEYRAWCASRGVAIHDDILASVDWRDGAGFEPSWAPYNLSNLDDERIEHWVLWHHPDQLPGDAVLRPERERALLAGLLRRHGAALPTSDRLVIFQNEPSRRSLPSIAHSQVFFRLGDPEGTELAATLERLRREWEERAVRRRQALDET